MIDRAGMALRPKEVDNVVLPLYEEPGVASISKETLAELDIFSLFRTFFCVDASEGDEDIAAFIGTYLSRDAREIRRRSEVIGGLRGRAEILSRVIVEWRRLSQAIAEVEHGLRPLLLYLRMKRALEAYIASVELLESAFAPEDEGAMAEIAAQVRVQKASAFFALARECLRRLDGRIQPLADIALAVNLRRETGDPVEIGVIGINQRPSRPAGLFGGIREGVDSLCDPVPVRVRGPLVHLQRYLMAHVEAKWASDIRYAMRELKKIELDRLREWRDWLRELQLYHKGLLLLEKLQALGMEVCRPEPSDVFWGEDMLYPHMALSGLSPVPQTLRLRAGEAVLVTGANSSGKSSILKSFLQHTLLAALGFWVPAQSLRFLPFARYVSVFATGEDKGMNASRFAQEAQGARLAIEAAGAKTCLLFNEPFTSTNPAEATPLLADIVEQLAQRGATVLLVTHLFDVYERLRVKGVEPRSYVMQSKERAEGLEYMYALEERPPDGLSYARELARACGFSLEKLARDPSCSMTGSREVNGVLRLLTRPLCGDVLVSESLLDDLELTGFLERFFDTPARYLTADTQALRERNEICRALLENEALTQALQWLYEAFLPLLETAPHTQDAPMEIIQSMGYVRRLRDAVQSFIQIVGKIKNLPDAFVELAEELIELLERHYPPHFDEMWERYASGVDLAASVSYSVRFSEDLAIESITLDSVNREQYTAKSLLRRAMGASGPMLVDELLVLVTGHYSELVQALNAHKTPQEQEQLSQSVRDLFLSQATASRAQLRFMERDLAQDIRGLAEELRFALNMVRYARALSSTLCFAEIDDDKGQLLCAKGMVHPVLLERGSAVPNDIAMRRDAVLLLVGGVNHGGKTTYLRTAGALQVLFQMGLPLPAISACLSPATGIFAVFAKAECTELAQGKLGSELTELCKALQQLDEDTLFLGNEPISGTSAAESLLLSREALCILKERGARGIWVSHLYELFDDVEKLNEMRFGSRFTCRHADPAANRSFAILPGAPENHSGARELFGAV